MYREMAGLSIMESVYGLRYIETVHIHRQVMAFMAARARVPITMFSLLAVILWFA
jgi:hypothetical protein